MIYFKSCQKCGGDVFEARDWYGDFYDCVQCGNHPLTVPNARKNGNILSIDSHVEALWLLQANGTIPKLALGPDPSAKFLERRLEGMAKYGYVKTSSNGMKSRDRVEYYASDPKGKSVVDAYRNLIKTILSHPKPNGSKGNAISSYELVDEDGKLTLIGKYFVQASTIIAKFVDDIYPMATLSTEHPETPEEPQKKQAVLN